MAPRYFYSVFVREPQIRGLLSTLRYLCDPQQKYAAHITLRGPYKVALRRRDLDRFSDRVEDSDVRVAGAGDFFGPKQNTVFLRCSGEGLRQAWYKPKLPYMPHMTLYDGDSYEFATALRALLDRYVIDFGFRATALYELVSAGGQHSFELSTTVRSAEIQALIPDASLPYDDVRFLGDSARLNAVEALCDLLFEPVGEVVFHPSARIRVPLLSTAAAAAITLDHVSSFWRRHRHH